MHRLGSEKQRSLNCFYLGPKLCCPDVGGTDKQVGNISLL